MPADAFIHLTSGEGASQVVERTLRGLGRDEQIVDMRDALHEGPLHDVDAGGKSRVDWWTRIHGESVMKDVDPGVFDDSDLWADVCSRSTSVVLWHGPHPMERIFALRACWYLRDQPERVHEVALQPSGVRWRGRPRPDFYDYVPIANVATMWLPGSDASASRTWRSVRSGGKRFATFKVMVCDSWTARTSCGCP